MTRLFQVVGIASAVFMLASCKDASGPHEADTFTATWADKSWRGDGGAVVVGDVLHIGGARKAPGQDYTLESVSIEITSPGVGTFPITAGKAAFFEWIGGDVIGAVYRSTPQSSGSVTLTRYDGPDGVVEGSVTFDAELVTGIGTYGQGNRLKQGQFSMRVLSVH